MQKNHISFIIILLVNFQLYGQFSDNFDQGNFDTWQGDSNKFEINNDNQLQLNDTEAGQSALYHNVTFTDSLIWNFDIKLRFSPSGGNNAKVLLAVDNPDLSKANGYILRLGQSGSDDAIDLIQLINGTETLIASGTPGFVASSFYLNINLVKNSSDDWVLTTTDLDDGSTSDQININFSDNITSDQQFFGFECLYTSSNADKFAFDNISINKIIADNEAPELIDLEVINAQRIELTFNEDLSTSSVSLNSNYSITNNSVNSTLFDSINNANKVILTLSDPLRSCVSSSITISNISDLNDNVISPVTRDISFFENPTVGDILINELLTNPIGNGVDYIEFINVSSKSIQMQGLIIRNESRNDEVIIENNLILQPRDIVVLTEAEFNVILNYGPPQTVKIIEQNIPGFNNADGNASLILEENFNRTIIDSYDYNDDQLDPNLENTDGVSFERISCIASTNSFSNWSSSLEANNFGTPGYTNSIALENDDQITARIVNKQEIEVRFKDEFDPTSVIDLSNYNIPNIAISDVIQDGSNPKVVVLFLEQELASGEMYTLTVSNIENSCGSILAEEVFNLRLVENAEVGDLLINEILFNPYKDQFDFVEIVNVSEKFIRIDNLNILNSDSGNDENIKSNVIIEPQQIIAFTENTAIVRDQYLPPSDANIILTNIPSFNDDSGNITLRISNGLDYLDLDVFDYSDDFHFDLIRDTEGISLERISLISDTNDASNWFSSAEGNLYATPGYENSSRLNPNTSEGQVSLAYKTFSPNGDSDKDVLFINYNLNKSGYVANVKIYDDHGRPQLILANNAILATEGFLRWDGINDEGGLSPVGMYIIQYEFFHPDGDVFEGKKVCILAQRLE